MLIPVVRGSHIKRAAGRALRGARGHWSACRRETSSGWRPSACTPRSPERRCAAGEFRIPQLATGTSPARRVGEVVARGKHLLTRVDGDRTVRTHSGWRAAGRSSVPPRSGTADGHHVRLVLAPTNGGAGYCLTTSTWCAPPRRNESSVIWVRTCSARTGTRTRRCAACSRGRSARRRGPGRPAQARRDRQPLQGRDPVPARRRPVDAGRRGPRPGRLVEVARRLMRRQQTRPRPEHDRQPPARPG